MTKKKKNKILAALTTSVVGGGAILASVAVSCAEPLGYERPDVAGFNNLFSNGVNQGTDNTFVAVIGSELCPVCRNYLDYDDSVREQRTRVSAFFPGENSAGFVNEFIIPFIGHGTGAFNNFARGAAANNGIRTYGLIDNFRTTETGSPEALLGPSNESLTIINQQPALYYAYWLRNDPSLLNVTMNPNGLTASERPLSGLYNETYYNYDASENIFVSASVPTSGEGENSGLGIPITLWVSGGNIAAWTIGDLSGTALNKGLTQFITFQNSSLGSYYPHLAMGVTFLTTVLNNNDVNQVVLARKFT